MGKKATNQSQDAMPVITRREKMVLHLMAQGKTSQEIADTLSISVLTVRSHTKRIYRKLDAHNKVEAINKLNSLMKN